MIIARTTDEYNKLMDALEASTGPVSFDTETQAFADPEDVRPWTLPIIGAGFYADGVSGYCRGSLLDARFQKLIKERVLLMHNAGFDLSVLEGIGFNVDDVKFYDTMLASYLLNENRRSHGLKNLAISVLGVEEVTRFDDIGAAPEDAASQEYLDWETRMGTYCVQDTEFTFRLFEHFRPKLMSDGLWKLFADLECPLADVLRRMSKRGIKVDIEYLENMKKRLEEELPKIEEEASDIICKDYEDEGLEPNIGSTPQLGEYLYKLKKYKIPDDFLTPAGKPSTNVEALKYIKTKYNCRIAELVLKHREFTKLLGTYVDGLLKRQTDGIIHTSFRQATVHTGRLSSAKPNLTNIGRRADEFDIRKAFIPRPGYIFVSGDFSQIEPRLAAYFSEDEKMLQVYEEGGDIHQLVADAVGRDRQTGKTLGLAILYGISGYGLGRRLGIDKEEAQEIINEYYRKFPKVHAFINSTIQEMRETYAVTSLLGRRRRFPEYAAARRALDKAACSRAERQCANAVIQGSAADIMKIAMRNVCKALRPYDAHMLLAIHDEIVAECRVEDADAVAEILKKEMEGAVDLKIIKMKVEPKKMERWAK